MLLPRWHRTLRDHRDRIAIHDPRRPLRFADLADALARLPPATTPLAARGPLLEVALASLRGWRDHQPVITGEADAAAPPAPAPPELAHFKTTPGASGEPRRIGFTAAQLAADVDRLVAAMELDPATPNLAVVAATPSYGYSSLVLPLLLHGIPIVPVEVPFPAVVRAAWRDHPGLVVPAVPSMWRAWQRAGILAEAPIRLALSAGAPLAATLEREVWDAHRLKIHNFYGASECGGISYDDSRTPRENPDSLGRPLDGVEVDLEGGRFLVRSDAVASGYDRPRPGERLGDGAFLTPDHGRLEDGRLILEARGSEQINVAGRKLGPARVERLLLADGAVDRARVFGIPSPDPERVDEVAALIPADADPAALRRLLARDLEGWEIPRHWFPVTDPTEFTRPRDALRRHYGRQP